MEEKLEQLTNSYEFLSAKYNQLLKQSKLTFGKIFQLAWKILTLLHFLAK